MVYMENQNNPNFSCSRCGDKIVDGKYVSVNATTKEFWCYKCFLNKEPCQRTLPQKPQLTKEKALLSLQSLLVYSQLSNETGDFVRTQYLIDKYTVDQLIEYISATN